MMNSIMNQSIMTQESKSPVKKAAKSNTKTVANRTAITSPMKDKPLSPKKK